LKPSDILDGRAYDDAVTAVLALGGSTNAVIHLIAMARRGGVPLDLDRFDALSRSVPVLANIRPSGEYLMEDFFYAGGLRGLLSRLQSRMHLDRPTVRGRSLRDDLDGAEVYDDRVIRRAEDPLQPEAGLAVLRGNLAPDGCVIKHRSSRGLRRLR
jgi:dihydroxyacid dehydratase/phosphogluconate dehydratase